MPWIEVQILDRRLTDENLQVLIEKLTTALCEVFGDELRDQTEVIVHGIPPLHFGKGGVAAR